MILTRHVGGGIASTATTMNNNIFIFCCHYSSIYSKWKYNIVRLNLMLIIKPSRLWGHSQSSQEEGRWVKNRGARRKIPLRITLSGYTNLK